MTMYLINDMNQCHNQGISNKDNYISQNCGVFTIHIMHILIEFVQVPFNVVKSAILGGHLVKKVLAQNQMERKFEVVWLSNSLEKMIYCVAKIHCLILYTHSASSMTSSVISKVIDPMIPSVFPGVSSRLPRLSPIQRTSQGMTGDESVLTLTLPPL